MFAPSNAMGAAIVNINGIVTKDKQAEIVVKVTDRATFPPANLVTQLEVAALGTHVIKIIPNFKIGSTGVKIANKNPIIGTITICNIRPVNKTLKL